MDLGRPEPSAEAVYWWQMAERTAVEHSELEVPVLRLQEENTRLAGEVSLLRGAVAALSALVQSYWG